MTCLTLDSRVFQGIRYAAPPVERRRWKKPQALRGSECDADADVDATRFGSKCLQWDWDGRGVIGACMTSRSCFTSANEDK